MKSRHLILLLLILNVLSCSSGNSEFDDYIMDLDEYVSKKDSIHNNDSSDSFPDSSDTHTPIDVLESKRKVTFMQWNIGHFGNGGNNTTIKDDDFDEKLYAYQDLINTINADFISISEYNVLFANTTNHKECYAEDVLFSNYKYNYIGNNGWRRHYSLNAFFTNLSVFESEMVEFECNQTATITYLKTIKATDYYYLRTKWKFKIEDQIKEVLIITTHFAFDKNNKEVALDQARELIKKYENEEFVIICGDFNSSLVADLFQEAGYTTANQGDWGNLYTYPSSSPRSCIDNIITKNLRIEDVRVIQTNLSDHLPIICSICI